MTKLRIIKEDPIIRKEYIEFFPVTLPVRFRLNVCKTKEYYRRKDITPQCRLCQESEETTKHMLICPTIEYDRIDASGLKQTGNFNKWKIILDRVDKT